MGFDKPDLGFVVHFQRPGSPTAYYQQVGRAGRAVDEAYGVLLSGREDDDIAEYFLATAFPPTARMEDVLRALELVESATIRDLQATVNLPYGQIEKALKLLEVDGAVARERGRYFRTLNPWQQDEAWIAGVLDARRRELASMREYVLTSECRMAFLARLLDDPTAEACGHCSNDGGRVWPREVNDDLVLAAISHLRRDARTIESRARDEGGRSLSHPNEEGLALCVYGDAGWGRLVAEGRDDAHRFDDQLVASSAALIASRWRPDPWPTWVTALPSAAHAGLVADFARRLADRLGLPYVDCLTTRSGAPPQKDMQNSVQLAANARAKLGIVGDEVRHGPVLLVDDIVDSRWTLTVAGSLLREHGSGPVIPFALAVAAARAS
jgi:ATP-dependent DNA helicase RecQ